MNYKVFNYRSSFIHYTLAGQGEKKVICLHGYGESGKHFAFLQNHYTALPLTIIAIDLPFHGKTEWKENGCIMPEDLVAIFEGILTENTSTPGITPEPYMLLGFSLGGRLALSCFQSCPERVEKLVLLAPDGLKVNGWYWLATQTWLGNKLFALTMQKPGWFFGLLKLMQKLKLVNSSIFKFVKYYIGDPEVRHLLYLRWTQFSKLKPSLPLIKNQISIHKTTVRLIYGKHDRIILTAVGHKFRKGIEPYCTLTEINCGHQVLHEKQVKEILSALLQ